MQMRAILLLLLGLAMAACSDAIGYSVDDDTADDDVAGGPLPDIDTNSPIYINNAPVGQTKTAPLVIRNEGEVTLTVYGVRVEVSAGHVVNADDYSGDIEPGEEVVLEGHVQATCIDPIEVMGILEVGSNDPHKPQIPVDVHVSCIAAPPQ